MTDFGTDISTPGGADLDPFFALVSGWTQLAQALVARITTPTGGLVDDPSYAIDVRAYLNDTPASTATIAAEIRAEWLRDERVYDASARVTFDEAAEALTVQGVVTTAEGTFALTVAIGAVTVDLLRVEGV